MPKYHVDLQEIWIQTIEVEADSSEEAQELVIAGGGNRLDDQLKYGANLESIDDVREVSD